MSDLTPDDELISAFLDGEGSPEELARGADPAWAERRDELDAARAAVATPVPALDPATVDRLIEQALDAAPAAPAAEIATSAEVATGAAADGGTVVTLASRRRRSTAILAAAAAIVLVVGVVGVLRARSNPAVTTDTAATAAGPVTTAASTVTTGEAPANAPTSTTQPSAGANKALPSDATSAGQPAPSGLNPVGGSVAAEAGGDDLGSLASTDELAAAARGKVGSTTTVPVSSTAAPTTTAPDLAGPASTTIAASPMLAPIPCDTEIRAANPGLTDHLYTGTATYRGLPVGVNVYRTVNGANVAIGYTESCEIVVSASF